MKRKLRVILSLIPAAAFLMTACAPVEENSEAGLALDEASDQFIVVNGRPSEYGHCWDGWDNNGNGFVDGEDLDCHINPGPLNDLSIFPGPQGHNFFPDISKVPPGGPGFIGGLGGIEEGFRNLPLISRWFRFLTNAYGYTSGYDLFAPGVNHLVAPVPMPLIPKVRQGTAAHGNNNNVFLYGVAPVGGAPSLPFAPGALGMPPSVGGGWPGPLYNGGSPGPLMKAAARAR